MNLQHSGRFVEDLENFDGLSAQIYLYLSCETITPGTPVRGRLVGEDILCRILICRWICRSKESDLVFYSYRYYTAK